MKRFLSISLALLLAFCLLAGCTPAAAPEPAPTDAAPAPAPAPDPAPPADTGAANMAPGNYTGTAFGFSWIDPIVVDVAVSETEILSITVVEAPRETQPIFQSAVDTIIPRILEAQSIAVDTITGATASSAGIRSAVTGALEQALEAGRSTGGLSAFQTVPAKSTAEETIDIDVLVVGMGGSGIATAMSAAEAMTAANLPVSVLAIDKAAKFGGTSSVCAEPLGVNAPRYKEAFNGGEDYMDAAAMRAAWEEYTLGEAKMDIVDTFLNNSGETIDWLFFDHGFVLNNPLKGFTAADVYNCKYQYVYQANMEEGRDYGVEFDVRYQQVDKYFKGIMGDYTALGGNYMLETEAYELIYDAATNKVSGVKAKGADGTTYNINAKAVVLATGGFGGNAAMQEKYFATNQDLPIAGVWGMYGAGMSHNDGKMIEAAINIGAGTFNIDMCPMVHNITTPRILRDYPVNVGEGFDRSGYPNIWSLNDVPMTMAINNNVLKVSPSGERFYNESEIFGWWRSGPSLFSIWSDAQVQEVQQNGFSQVTTTGTQGQGGVPVNTPIPEVYEIIDKAIAAGYMYKANTLQELAAMTGMDAATLEASVSTYNEICANGEDTQFGKAPEHLWALGDSGPYYAINAMSAIFNTCGGLDIDTSFRVLKADGATPIDGLYAVGNDSGGVLYTNKKPYVTFGGAALGWAFTSGRLTGGIAVEYAQG